MFGYSKARKKRHSPSATGEMGFTLVELMVVVAIIGILAAIGIPQLTKFIKMAETADPVNMMGDLAKNIQGWVDSKYNMTAADIQAALDGKRVSEAEAIAAGDEIPIAQFRLPQNHPWTYEIVAITITPAKLAYYCLAANKPGGDEAAFQIFMTNRTIPEDALANWDGQFYRAEYVNQEADDVTCAGYAVPAS